MKRMAPKVGFANPSPKVKHRGYIDEELAGFRVYGRFRMKVYRV